jgi:hypothetical protein
MAAERIPRKKAIAEGVIVADMAETALIHGYHVTSHTVTHNHERDETKLSVSFVKSSGAEKQGVLKLRKGEGDNGEGGGLNSPFMEVDAGAKDTGVHPSVPAVRAGGQR